MYGTLVLRDNNGDLKRLDIQGGRIAAAMTTENTPSSLAGEPRARNIRGLLGTPDLTPPRPNRQGILASILDALAAHDQPAAWDLQQQGAKAFAEANGWRLSDVEFEPQGIGTSRRGRSAQRPRISTIRCRSFR
jgi:hypothetical protein